MSLSEIQIFAYKQILLNAGRDDKQKEIDL